MIRVGMVTPLWSDIHPGPWYCRSVHWVIGRLLAAWTEHPRPVWQVRWVVLSEHSGDDGEGYSRAAGLQLQGRQEALGGCCVVALSLEDLAQPVPDLMGG